MTRGGGVVWKTPKYDDIISEWPLILHSASFNLQMRLEFDIEETLLVLTFLHQYKKHRLNYIVQNPTQVKNFWEIKGDCCRISWFISWMAEGVYITTILVCPKVFLLGVAYSPCYACILKC